MAFMRPLLTLSSLLPAALAIQQRASLDRKGDGPLPSVGEVLLQPRKVFSSVGSDIATLRQRLSEAQQESQAEVEKQEAAYEARLAAQTKDNAAVAAENQRITEEIKGLQQSSEKLRQNATRIEHATAALTKSLQILKSNITYAQEFLARTLNDSHVSLHESSDLHVLSELDEIEKKQDEELEQQLRYKEIGGFEPTHIAMLQLATRIQASKSKGPSAPGLLELLSQSLDELKQEQNTSELALKEAFQVELAKLIKHRDALFEKQEGLNSTRAHEAELNEQLVAAADRLQITHDNVLVRTRALRAFVQRIAKRPRLEPKASLLQGHPAKAQKHHAKAAKGGK